MPAIASISSKAIMEVPVTNVQQALQGSTPGIDVINNSAKPGDEPRVRVRGTRSLSAGNDSLIDRSSNEFGQNAGY